MSTDTRSAELSRLFGEDVKALRPQWERIFAEDAVVINVHLHAWRGTTRQVDIDIDPAGRKVFGRLLRAGQKLLMPEEVAKRMAAIDSRARAIVADPRTGICSHWGQLWPLTTFEENMARLRECEKEWYFCRDVLAGSDEAYTTFVNLMQGEYREHAQELWKSIPSGQSEAAFVDGYVQRYLAQVPSREEIYNSFRFRVELQYIPTPAELEADRQKAEISRLSHEDQLRLARINKDISRAEEEERLSRARASAAVAAAAAVEAETDYEQRKRLVQEMHRQVVESQRVVLEEQMEEMVAQVAINMRAAIFDLATNVVAYLSNTENRGLHQRQVLQVKNTIKTLRKFSAWINGKDVESEKAITLLQNVIKQSSTQRTQSSDDLRALFLALSASARASLIALGSDPLGINEKDVWGQANADHFATAVQLGRAYLDDVWGEAPALPLSVSVLATASAPF